MNPAEQARLAQSARVLMVVSAAMASGVVALALVVALLPAGQPAEGLSERLRVFAAINVLLNAVLWPLSFRLGAVRPGSGLAALQTAHILRLAPREGGALFGLIVCLLAKPLLAEEPAWWLNALPAAVFVLSVFLNFPSEASLRDRLAEASAAGGASAPDRAGRA